MANFLYIPSTSLSNPATPKLFRLVQETYPQVVAWIDGQAGPFQYPPGVPRAPGIVFIANVDLAPVVGPVTTQAINFDGSVDPPVTGVSIPQYPNVASLPVQPPPSLLNPTQVYLAAVLSPQERLYYYIPQTQQWERVK